MQPKDNFSTQADLYARYRPNYPQELIDFLLHLTPKPYKAAWDCATGNGQVAQAIAPFFEHIYATDLSEKQLEHAPQQANVQYQVATAENAPHIPDHSCQLITVAQAIHWIDTTAFYKEAHRIATPNALLAIWGYGLHKINPQIDTIIQHFYTQIVGKYWDEERKHIDQAYSQIPFPYSQITTPEFFIEKHWDLHTLIGYLNTWSSTQKYIKIHQQNPIEAIQKDLQNAWQNPNENKPIRWNIFMKTTILS
ncbi:MAG: class I SAM-dependent methyltransferase [Cytophagales bacterium]|nr:MAG: class I SAM-dependent methyltransferase [Cytophagales bacterium]